MENAMTVFGGSSYNNQIGCGQRVRDPARAKRAAEDQVALMREKLDVRIDPVAWRLFLRLHFSRMSSLAHTIHENED
jgi:hypothetical protein